MHPTGLTLAVVVALLGTGADDAVGQSHDPASTTDVGALHSGDGLDNRSEPDSAWPAPTGRAAKLFAANATPPTGQATGLAPVVSMPQARNRRGVPYMVAGGILFIAGAIVEGDGGTLLMLGGAGIGAYGAYVYFGG